MSKHDRFPWRTLNQHVTAHRTHARTHTYKDRHASTHTQIQTHSHYAGSKVSICSCKSFRPQCEVIKSHELKKQCRGRWHSRDWLSGWDHLLYSVSHLKSVWEKSLTYTDFRPEWWQNWLIQHNLPTNKHSTPGLLFITHIPKLFWPKIFTWNITEILS